MSPGARMAERQLIDLSEWQHDDTRPSVKKRSRMRPEPHERCPRTFAAGFTPLNWPTPAPWPQRQRPEIERLAKPNAGAERAFEPTILDGQRSRLGRNRAGILPTTAAGIALSQAAPVFRAGERAHRHAALVLRASFCEVQHRHATCGSHPSTSTLTKDWPSASWRQVRC
jgi:hypothetical protein